MRHTLKFTRGALLAVLLILCVAGAPRAQQNPQSEFSPEETWYMQHHWGTANRIVNAPYMVDGIFSPIYIEDFDNLENGMALQEFRQEFKVSMASGGNREWEEATEGGSNQIATGAGIPPSAKYGLKMVRLFAHDDRAVTRLIFPKIDLSGVLRPQLAFYYALPKRHAHDNLYVYLGVEDFSVPGGVRWMQEPIQKLESEAPGWEFVTVDLAAHKNFFQGELAKKVIFGFEGRLKGGWGVSLDRVVLYDASGRTLQVKDNAQYNFPRTAAASGTKGNVAAVVRVEMQSGSGYALLTKFSPKITRKDRDRANVVGNVSEIIESLTLYRTRTNNFSPVDDETLPNGTKVCDLTFDENGQVTAQENWANNSPLPNDIFKAGAYYLWLSVKMKKEIPEQKLGEILEVEFPADAIEFLVNSSDFNPNGSETHQKRKAAMNENTAVRMPKASVSDVGGYMDVYDLIFSDGFEYASESDIKWKYPTGTAASLLTASGDNTRGQWRVGKLDSRTFPYIGNSAMLAMFLDPAQLKIRHGLSSLDGWRPIERLGRAYDGEKVLATAFRTGEGQLEPSSYDQKSNPNEMILELKQPVNCLHHRDVRLRFALNTNLRANARFRVEVRNMEGGPWVSVDDKRWSSAVVSDVWQQVEIPLGRLVDHMAHVELRFILDVKAAQSFDAAGIYIDDVQLIGWKVLNDLSIESVSPIYKDCQYGKALEFKVVVRNRGKNDIALAGQNVKVSFSVNGKPSDPGILNEDIRSGESKEFIFKDVLPEPSQDEDNLVNVRARLDYQDDNLQNNRKDVQFYNYPTFEITEQTPYPKNVGARMKHWFPVVVSGFQSSWGDYAAVTLEPPKGKDFHLGKHPDQYGNPPHSHYVWATGRKLVSPNWGVAEESSLESPVFDIPRDKNLELVLDFAQYGGEFSVEYWNGEVDNNLQSLDKRVWRRLNISSSSDDVRLWYNSEKKFWNFRYDASKPLAKPTVYAPEQATGQHPYFWDGYLTAKILLNANTLSMGTSTTAGTKVQLRLRFKGLDNEGTPGVAVNQVQIRPVRPNFEITDLSPDVPGSNGGSCADAIPRTAPLKIKVKNSGRVPLTQEGAVQAMVTVGKLNGSGTVESEEKHYVSVTLPSLEVGAESGELEFNPQIIPDWDGMNSWGYQVDVQLDCRTHASLPDYGDEEDDDNHFGQHIFEYRLDQPLIPEWLPKGKLAARQYNWMVKNVPVTSNWEYSGGAFALVKSSTGGTNELTITQESKLHDDRQNGSLTASSTGEFAGKYRLVHREDTAQYRMESEGRFCDITDRVTISKAQDEIQLELVNGDALARPLCANEGGNVLWQAQIKLTKKSGAAINGPIKIFSKVNDADPVELHSFTSFPTSAFNQSITFTKGYNSLLIYVETPGGVVSSTESRISREGIFVVGNVKAEDLKIFEAIGGTPNRHVKSYTTGDFVNNFSKISKDLQVLPQGRVNYQWFWDEAMVGDFKPQLNLYTIPLRDASGHFYVQAEVMACPNMPKVKSDTVEVRNAELALIGFDNVSSGGQFCASESGDKAGLAIIVQNLSNRLLTAQSLLCDIKITSRTGNVLKSLPNTDLTIPSGGIASMSSVPLLLPESITRDLFSDSAVCEVKFKKIKRRSDDRGYEDADPSNNTLVRKLIAGPSPEIENFVADGGAALPPDFFRTIYPRGVNERSFSVAVKEDTQNKISLSTCAVDWEELRDHGQWAKVNRVSGGPSAPVAADVSYFFEEKSEVLIFRGRPSSKYRVIVTADQGKGCKSSRVASFNMFDLAIDQITSPEPVTCGKSGLTNRVDVILRNMGGSNIEEGLNITLNVEVSLGGQKLLEYSKTSALISLPAEQGDASEVSHSLEVPGLKDLIDKHKQSGLDIKVWFTLPSAPGETLEDVRPDNNTITVQGVKLITDFDPLVTVENADERNNFPSTFNFVGKRGDKNQIPNNANFLYDGENFHGVLANGANVSWVYESQKGSAVTYYSVIPETFIFPPFDHEEMYVSEENKQQIREMSGVYEGGGSSGHGSGNYRVTASKSGCRAVRQFTVRFLYTDLQALASDKGGRHSVTINQKEYTSTDPEVEYAPSKPAYLGSCDLEQNDIDLAFSIKNNSNKQIPAGEALEVDYQLSLRVGSTDPVLIKNPLEHLFGTNIPPQHKTFNTASACAEGGTIRIRLSGINFKRLLKDIQESKVKFGDDQTIDKEAVNKRLGIELVVRVSHPKDKNKSDDLTTFRFVRYGTPKMNEILQLVQPVGITVQKGKPHVFSGERDKEETVQIAVSELTAMDQTSYEWSVDRAELVSQDLQNAQGPLAKVKGWGKLFFSAKTRDGGCPGRIEVANLIGLAANPGIREISLPDGIGGKEFTETGCLDQVKGRALRINLCLENQATEMYPDQVVLAGPKPKAVFSCVIKKDGEVKSSKTSKEYMWEDLLRAAFREKKGTNFNFVPGTHGISAESKDGTVTEAWITDLYDDQNRPIFDASVIDGPGEYQVSITLQSSGLGIATGEDESNNTASLSFTIYENPRREDREIDPIAAPFLFIQLSADDESGLRDFLWTPSNAGLRYEATPGEMPKLTPSLSPSRAKVYDPGTYTLSYRDVNSCQGQTKFTVSFLNYLEIVPDPPTGFAIDGIFEGCTSDLARLQEAAAPRVVLRNRGRTTITTSDPLARGTVLLTRFQEKTDGTEYKKLYGSEQDGLYKESDFTMIVSPDATHRLTYELTGDLAPGAEQTVVLNGELPYPTGLDRALHPYSLVAELEDNKFEYELVGEAKPRVVRRLLYVGKPPVREIALNNNLQFSTPPLVLSPVIGTSQLKSPWNVKAIRERLQYRWIGPTSLQGGQQELRCESKADLIPYYNDSGVAVFSWHTLFTTVTGTTCYSDTTVLKVRFQHDYDFDVRFKETVQSTGSACLPYDEKSVENKLPVTAVVSLKKVVEDGRDVTVPLLKRSKIHFGLHGDKSTANDNQEYTLTENLPLGKELEIKLSNDALVDASGTMYKLQLKAQLSDWIDQGVTNLHAPFSCESEIWEAMFRMSPRFSFNPKGTGERNILDKTEKFNLQVVDIKDPSRVGEEAMNYEWDPVSASRNELTVFPFTDRQQRHIRLKLSDGSCYFKDSLLVRFGKKVKWSQTGRSGAKGTIEIHPYDGTQAVGTPLAQDAYVFETAIQFTITPDANSQISNYSVMPEGGEKTTTSVSEEGPVTAQANFDNKNLELSVEFKLKSTGGGGGGGGTGGGGGGTGGEGGGEGGEGGNNNNNGEEEAVEDACLAEVRVVVPIGHELILLHTERVARYEVFNQLGTLVTRAAVDGALPSLRIPADAWPAGLYVIRLYSVEGTPLILRAVKQ